MQEFDAVVIGAGQAGGPLAGALSKAGWKVAIIEEKHVGGTCVNVGCTPTKTMVASARVAHLARKAADHGVQVSDAKVDLSKVWERKDNMVHKFREGSQSSLEKHENVTLIFGHASFVGERIIKVQTDAGERTLKGGHVFINTGTRNRIPDVPGLQSVPFLDSTSLQNLTEVPEHLIFLGSGYIGLEFGQMFRRFGSEVTLLEQENRLLPREDEDTSETILNMLQDEGIKVHLHVEVQRIRPADSGVEVLLKDGRSIKGSHLVVSAGRVPNTDRLDVHSSGIELDDHGYVQVNENLETTAKNIYALGDVKGGPAFTHLSYDDYRIVRDALLEGKKRSYHERPLPYTMFTDPQLAHVGLSEQQARKSHPDARMYKLQMSRVARALETGETTGFMKAIVDSESGKLLGATIIGTEAGETMTALQLAMLGGLTADDLKNMVFAHPTFAESINNLFMAEPRSVSHKE